jgi:hypothetical protein
VLFLEIDNKGLFRTQIYDKGEDSNFPCKWKVNNGKIGIFSFVVNLRSEKAFVVNFEK